MSADETYKCCTILADSHEEVKARPYDSQEIKQANNGERYRGCQLKPYHPDVGAL